MWHWNYEKSTHKSTEAEREKLEKKLTNSSARSPSTRSVQKKIQKNQEKKLPVRVPSQGRLAISRLRVPNLDSCVQAAAGDLFSIGAPRHWCDPEITKSQYTNQQNQRGKNLEKNLPAQVPGHRRLAISRLRVPNLDGAVATAAGNLLSVRAPCHRPNPVIARNQYTNQQKKEVKNGKKTYTFECRLGKVNIESFKFLYFQHLFIKKSYVFEWPVSWTLKQEHKIGIIFL